MEENYIVIIIIIIIIVVRWALGVCLFESWCFRLAKEVFWFLFVLYHFHIRFRQLSIFRCSVGRAYCSSDSEIPIHAEDTNE